VGRIFLEAGAKHVICIDQEAEVMDEAVISFTDTFYDMILRQTVPIPEAYAKAQLVVNISYGEKEGQIFKLLNHSSTLAQDADEQVFGPFDEGKWVNNDIDVVLPSLPQRVPNFFGRQKDMFKLICKVMENESSRLLTLVGLPGVGKTALVRNTMHHICERRLLRGGCIFSNAQNI
jgi:Cdc6-like AAA superfamily ATPase